MDFDIHGTGKPRVGQKTQGLLDKPGFNSSKNVVWLICLESVDQLASWPVHSPETKTKIINKNKVNRPLGH
jgi:hypothetical protein